MEGKVEVKINTVSANSHRIMLIVADTLIATNRGDLSAFFMSKAIISRDKEELLLLAKQFVNIVEG